MQRDRLRQRFFPFRPSLPEHNHTTFALPPALSGAFLTKTMPPGAEAVSDGASSDFPLSDLVGASLISLCTALIT